LAADGRVGCELAMQARTAGRPFDLVLMDLRMPDVNGYEATAQLRSAGFAGPIIALTAYAMAGDREKCLAAGFDEYATKPIIRAELLRTVSRHLHGPGH
jgi:CheY-like chemotaxis protein